MWFIWGHQRCWTNPIQHFFPGTYPLTHPPLYPKKQGKTAKSGIIKQTGCTEGDDAIFNVAPGCVMKHPTWNITTGMAENPYNTLKDILNNNANNIQVNIIFEIAWLFFYPEQSLKNSCQANMSLCFFKINSKMVHVLKQKEAFSMISWSIQKVKKFFKVSQIFKIHYIKILVFLYKCKKQSYFIIM